MNNWKPLCLIWLTLSSYLISANAQTATTSAAELSALQENYYVPLKFDLGLGNATTISTPTGEDDTGYIASVLDASATFEPGVSALNVGFVKPDGARFSIDGKPWYCAGTNAYYAPLKFIMSDNEMAVMMKTHKDFGANVMRVFAHSNFDSVPGPTLMPEFGKYNEDAFKRMDLMLLAAAQNNIRLIMVLSNYWPFLGGMQAWVDKALGTGKGLNLFYTDPTVKAKFKDWVKTIVTRTNSLTGQKYSDDPTIMAWELANEPRNPNSGEAVKGREICNWTNEMAEYVKSLDKNHMVGVGDEGLRSDGNPQEPHSWLNNGYDGVDYTCNTKSPYIDFGTLHTYPEQWGISVNELSWLRDDYIADRAKLVQQTIGKPLVYEEYGMAPGYQPTRDQQLRYLQNAGNANNVACTLVWAVSHYSAEGTFTNDNLYGSNDNQGYIFGYTGGSTDGKAAVLEQYKYMKDKTGSVGTAPIPKTQPAPSPQTTTCTDNPPPPGTYTCAQQKSWGKCGESWMKGYCLQSCFNCQSQTTTCTDIPPPPGTYTCAQQKSWGKCNESWMKGYCLTSCGGCKRRAFL